MANAERRFLEMLKRLLGLDATQVEWIEGEIGSIVDQTEAAAPANSGIAVATSPAGPVAAQPKVAEAELDESILNYSLLNGALELLPQSWASMAIIPVQIRMVYGIGRAHGVELDQGHIKEFIAAAGVGLTAQYLEQIGRKLLGGLLGKVGGTAVGMAFSFATTYALGQVAKRYYTGGRTMNTAMLRDAFQNLLGPAKQMQAKFLPQIQQKAATLDAGQIMALMRGNAGSLFA